MILKPRTTSQRIMVAGAGTLLAAAARAFADPWLGDRLPFSAFFPAVLIAAVCGGGRAAGTALLLSTTAGWFLFVPERVSWFVGPRHLPDVALFVGCGAIVGGVGVLLRRTVESLEELRHEHQNLVTNLSIRLEHDFKVVAAVARAAARSDSPSSVGHTFGERVTMMRQATPACRGNGCASTVRGVILDALRYYPLESRQRILLKGGDVILGHEAAVVLGICVWELASRAALLGALSRAHGRVDVSWTLSEGSVHLCWLEQGGPLQTLPLPPFLEAFSRDPTVASFNWNFKQADGYLELTAQFAARPREPDERRISLAAAG